MVDATAQTGRIGMTSPIAEALAEFRRFNYEQVYLRPASRAQAEAVDRPAACARRALRRPTPPAPRAAAGGRWLRRRGRCSGLLRRRDDRPLRLPPGRLAARLGPGEAARRRHLTRNPTNPSGGSSTTSIPVTSARGGPIRHQATISATAASAPSNTASTAAVEAVVDPAGDVALERLPAARVAEPDPLHPPVHDDAGADDVSRR